MPRGQIHRGLVAAGARRQSLARSHGKQNRPADAHRALVKHQLLAVAAAVNSVLVDVDDRNPPRPPSRCRQSPGNVLRETWWPSEHVFQPDWMMPVAAAAEDLAGVGIGQAAIARVGDRRVRIAQVEMVERVQTSRREAARGASR